MSCDSCQDCGCGQITLPVATGSTGATGATGPAGADGANGFTVLYNDTDQSTTNSASTALFSPTKSFSVPAGTLSTNGSKLIVTAVFSTTGAGTTGQSEGRIFIGGMEFTAKVPPFYMRHSSSNSEFYLKVRLEISRNDATTLFINCDTDVCVDDSSIGNFHFINSSFAVADVDVNNLVIDARGKTTGATTVNCDQLTIDHSVK